MKLKVFHSLAAAFGIEDCSMSTMDAASTIVSLFSPYSGPVWSTDVIHLQSCQHASTFEESAATFGMVIAFSIVVWLIAQLALPRTPPRQINKDEHYNFPKLVSFMETLPFLCVITVLTMLDLACSIIEMLSMHWLLGDYFNASVMHFAEHVGFAVTLWMVVEMQVTVVAQGFITFFSDKSEILAYVAIMVDFGIDLFAKELEGIAGLLLFVRAFKIYKVVDSFEDGYEHFQKLDEEMQHVKYNPDGSVKEIDLKDGEVLRPAGEEGAPRSKWCC